MIKYKKTMVSAAIIAIVTTTLIACGIHRHHSTPENHLNHMIKEITDQLDLTANQVTQLKALENEALLIVNEAKDKHASLHQEIESMLSQPTLDQDRLLTLVQEKTDQINRKAPTMIAAMARFYDSLEPEQQAQLLSKFQEHKKHSEGCFHK